MKPTKSKAKAAAAPKRGPGRPRREEPRERLTIILPPELKRTLRIRAVEEDRDVSELVADAIHAYLRKR